VKMRRMKCPIETLSFLQHSVPTILSLMTDPRKTVPTGMVAVAPAMKVIQVPMTVVDPTTKEHLNVSR
jgi:hypothetical protein